MRLYGQTCSVQTGITSSQPDASNSDWETLISSPLINSDGENKYLKLQFDLSQFDPSEVKKHSFS